MAERALHRQFTRCPYKHYCICMYLGHRTQRSSTKVQESKKKHYARCCMSLSPHRRWSHCSFRPCFLTIIKEQDDGCMWCSNSMNQSAEVMHKLLLLMPGNVCCYCCCYCLLLLQEHGSLLRRHTRGNRSMGQVLVSCCISSWYSPKHIKSDDAYICSTHQKL